MRLLSPLLRFFTLIAAVASFPTGIPGDRYTYKNRMRETLTEPNGHSRTPAPLYTYWVYTEKGSRIHQTRPGAVVHGDPYLVPSLWINEGLVAIEELE